ncbi:MAG: Hpt domain-containing protein [Zoogloeaceae bacterium]|jgi:chemosensory pili system protein ChpA (sensor histidine kinase/response regulator)|nr:Hpt domain-containing protein [Zoogloeaceae bacterium]
MNAATDFADFDIGPLTWIKGEVELALARAAEALQQFQTQKETTQIKFARTHLQQVHGALTMVGLDGVTQVVDALNLLLAALENKTGVTGTPDQIVAMAGEGFDALRQYLDDLVAGEPNQPLRLLPVYQKITRMLGKSANPVDLFFPNLNLRPPKRVIKTPLGQAERHKLIQRERNHFQKGLLAWLRQPGDSPASQSGLEQMQQALQRIEAIQSSPASRSFWWAALGLVTALAHGASKVGDARSLCARIDQQIRRLQQGNPGIAERLLRDCLYFVANTPAQAHPLLAEIQSTYHLPGLVPSRSFIRTASSAQETALRRLKEAVVTAEEQWNRFCAGSATSLSTFAEQVSNAARFTKDLDENLKSLVGILAAAASWLTQDPTRHSDSLAMEIATSLLLVQGALENYNRLDSSDFGQRAQLMIARLKACVAGRSLSGAEAPLLDEVSRRAQEKMLMAQVAREIQNNLAQIEQILDAYFREPSKRPDAASLEGPLNQVGGALSILGQDDAVIWLNDCEEKILGFTKPDSVANQEDFESIAQQLSALSLFIDTLQNSKSNFRDYMERYFQSQAKKPEEEEEEEILEEAPAASVESQLERLKAETRQLLAAIQENPEDATLRAGLMAHLEELQKDADLVADQGLQAQVKAALAALSKHQNETSQITAVTEALEPAATPAPAPSSETLQLAQAGAEELDAELLAIFLEEAQEVLTSMSDNLALLRQHPHDTETLTTIRRGVHTLKGSGRMVGLKDLGETAWAVEQTLNFWLRQEALATPDLLDLVHQTHQVFSTWVNALSSGNARMPDSTALIARAEALRGDESAAAPVSTPQPAAEPESEPEPEVEPEAEPEAEPERSSIVVDDDDDIPEELRTSRFDLSLLGMDENDPIEAAPQPKAQENLSPELNMDLDLDTLPEAAVPSTGIESEPLSITTSNSVTISPQLYEIFRDESRGHLDTLQNFLSMLTESPGMETPYEAGRAAHTLAGIAGTVGILSVNKLAHELEATLLRRDESEHPETLEGQEILRQAVVMLEDMQEILASGRMPEAQPVLIDALSQLYPSAPNEKIAKESAPVAASAAPVAPAVPAVVEAEVVVPPPVAESLPTTSPVAEAPSAQEEDNPDAELLEIFLEETQDLVPALYHEVNAWRSDRESKEAPDSLARILHTFKGSARMAGALNLGGATHQLEDRVRELEARGQIGDDDLDNIEAACDVLAQSVERYSVGDYSIPILPESATPLPPAAASQEATPATPSPVEPEILLTGGDPAVPAEAAEAVEPVKPVESEKTDALPTAAIRHVSDELPADQPPVISHPVPLTPVEMPDELIVDADAKEAEALPLLQDELDEQLFPIFLEEAEELIGGFAAQITAWRKDRMNPDASRALARLLHTFKGSARMAGAMNLGELAHACESRVDELTKSGEIRDEDLDEIASACDTLAQSVEHYRKGELKIPSPDTVADDTKPSTDLTPAAVATAPDAPARAAPATATPRAHEGEVAHAQLRVRADLIDTLVNEAGELSIARARIEGEMREVKASLLYLTENVIRLRRQLREIEIQAETQIQANTGQEAKADFDPLELDRFTRFQELTRMMAESVNDVATVQQNLLKNLDDANAAIVAQARLNRGLQQSLMSVRMVPFASQSERLYRLVRQTAKELGKRATLDIHGGQVELDRSVLEKILSPLEHMLRNAVAHGLEARDVRLAAGKPEIGEINLTLVQEGNEIIVSLSDDGSGLDIKRIRAKAESAGLIAPEQAMADQQLIDFIFSSGFTTAASVSQIAGRGVGMDVVKTEITALGGRIEILTRQGQGTTFRLYLPLTLAVTQVVLIQAGGKLLAVPSAMVEQVMDVPERIINEMRDKGEAVWQGKHYPFYYLPHLLGDTQSQTGQRRLYWVMLLRSGTQRVGVLIDEMFGNQEIVVKNVGPQMARVVGISGATVLGDGKVVLILNPVALANRMTLSATVAAAQDAASVKDSSPVVLDDTPVVRRQPIVLVVDDSLTVRKITSKLLAREGYRVELAKDGVDALEQLVELMPDVILSDIEMPRMDGFDLVRNIRSDHRLDKVPVIMITSRTADKHRNLAMEIGANQYLGKPYNEVELLRLLADYTEQV